VSLRDVERAMIVFKYFYERMNLFGPLMDKRVRDEHFENFDIESDDEVHIFNIK